MKGSRETIPAVVTVVTPATDVVTLTLSAEEAQSLSNMLSHVPSLDFESIASKTLDALREAGVNWEADRFPGYRAR